MTQSTSLRARASGGQVAHQQQGQQTIAGFISSMREEIARALPKHLDPDRVARIALTCVRKTPKLADCSRESFAGALLTAAQLGLEPSAGGGAGGEAYLIPYNRECQFIVGYQGYAKLFWQHPLAAHLDAQAVYEADDFDYSYGLRPDLRHRPARGERGDVVDYYAVGTLRTGAAEFVVLSPEECKRLRGGKVGPSGNIADPMRWMERKTALRQLFKLLPKSPTLVQAMYADEGVRRDLNPAAIEDPSAFAHPAIEQAPAVVEPDVDPETGEIIPTDVPGWDTPRRHLVNGPEHYCEAEKWLKEAEAQDWYTSDERERSFAQTRLLAAQVHATFALTAATLDADADADARRPSIAHGWPETLS